MQIYPLGEAVTAMRELAAARHIGKVVLRVESSLRLPDQRISPGRWMVTGGMGALGAAAGTHNGEKPKKYPFPEYTFQPMA